MTRRTLTDAERIASIREVITAARGDWHEATALWSVGDDLTWLLERAEPSPAEGLREALLRLGEPRQLPQTYTVLPDDPNEPGVKKNPDGTTYEEHYYQYVVGEDDVAAIRAALTAEPDRPSGDLDAAKRALADVEDFLTTTIGLGRIDPARAFSPARIEAYEALMQKHFPEAWAFFRGHEAAARLEHDSGGEG